MFGIDGPMRRLTQHECPNLLDGIESLGLDGRLRETADVWRGHDVLQCDQDGANIWSSARPTSMAAPAIAPPRGGAG